MRLFSRILVLIACAFVVSACDGGSSSTGPTPIEPAVQTAAAFAPASAGAPAPAPATEESICDPQVLRKALTWTVGQETISFTLVNKTGLDCPSNPYGTIWFAVYVRKGGSEQLFYSDESKGKQKISLGRLRAGEKMTGTLRIPCDPWQADLTFDEPTEPPTFSGGYHIGHKFGDGSENKACAPLPEPTHTNATCDATSVPSASFTGFNDRHAAGAWHLDGHVAVAHAGTWHASLHAAESEAECLAGIPHFTAHQEAQHLPCGASANLTVSFPWGGHRSEWWWVTVKHDGTQVARSACVRNSHN